MSDIPQWANIINNALERAKLEPKPIKEKLILNSKDDGLLWSEMLKALKELEKGDRIIKLPYVFEKICPKFQITKSKAWNCLFFLSEFSIISISTCRGIKLNYILKS